MGPVILSHTSCYNWHQQIKQQWNLKDYNLSLSFRSKIVLHSTYHPPIICVKVCCRNLCCCPEVKGVKSKTTHWLTICSPHTDCDQTNLLQSVSNCNSLSVCHKQLPQKGSKAMHTEKKTQMNARTGANSAKVTDKYHTQTQLHTNTPGFLLCTLTMTNIIYDCGGTYPPKRTLYTFSHLWV